MASRLTLSLFLIVQLIKLNGQTGAGCPEPTCSDPNKIRLDAILDAQGEFLGGCQCICDPAFSDPTSPTYCAPPFELNFNPTTNQGDCSCGCSSIQEAECTSPSIWHPNTCECELRCHGNQAVDPQTGTCSCPEIAPNGKRFPICNFPLTKDPITCDCVTPDPTRATPAPLYPTNKPSAAPIIGGPEVTCSDFGSCWCPYAVPGVCTVNCDGTPDSCKDGIIGCNDDNDCVVNCISENSCGGSTEIRGPRNGKLTVNCIGKNSCGGGPVKVKGETSTDVTVNCDGGASCKSADIQLFFGNGIAEVGCYGVPDACQGLARFNLRPNARITPGFGFACNGQFCPASAPQPFLNTFSPTSAPTPAPTTYPTPAPTTNPTYNPSKNPTTSPTKFPTSYPTKSPSKNPTIFPTKNPTLYPTNNPIKNPTQNPTKNPTAPPVVPIVPIPAPVPGWNPNPSIPAPLPPINPIPPNPGTPPLSNEITCWRSGGQCQCPLVAGDCIINCNGNIDACKDGIIRCNGYNCVVNCITENSCSGSTQITGPVGMSLTVNCYGKKACEGSINVEGQYGSDLTVVCYGGESCKGNAQFNYGNGRGLLYCYGAPDSCQGATINKQFVSGFQCIGEYCPASAFVWW